MAPRVGVRRDEVRLSPATRIRMAAVHQRRGWWMRLDFSGAFGEVSGRKTPKASRVVRSELIVLL